MSGKNKPTRDCACGCGGQTKSTWYPGHDGRATGWATRIAKGVITIEDVPANERKGAAIMMARRGVEIAIPAAGPTQAERKAARKAAKEAARAAAAAVTTETTEAA
jgi:hypothetical protein